MQNDPYDLALPRDKPKAAPTPPAPLVPMKTDKRRQGMTVRVRRGDTLVVGDTLIDVVRKSGTSKLTLRIQSKDDQQIALVREGDVKVGGHDQEEEVLQLVIDDSCVDHVQAQQNALQLDK